MKKKLLVMAVLILSSMSLAGCATKVAVTPSATLPAAAGETKLTRDANGNTVVNLKVRHFAPVQNLQPPKSTYVVWVETPDRQLMNLGQLRIGQDREGKLTATTPFKTFRLLISAEDFPTVKQPSNQVVLVTDILEAK